MLTIHGIRNAFWCAVAFGIVGCTSTLPPLEWFVRMVAATDSP